MHSGLTHWGKIFKGDYHIPNYDEIENYDVIHINYTPSNIGKVKYIHKLINGRDTKIVLNIDHAVDLWAANGFVEINQMIDEIKLADHLFSVETVMASTMTELLDREVHLIPHPTDVEMIRKNFYRKKTSGKGISITVFIHSYDKNWLLITNLISQLKEEMDISAIAVGSLDNLPAFFRNTFDMLYNRVSLL